MQSNLPHTDQHQTNAGFLKKCGFCSRSNPAVARFCGGCGRSTRFSIIQKVPQVDAAPSISRPTIKPKQRKTLFRGRSLRQLVARHKTVASSFLLAVLFSMSGFLFFSQRPVSIGEAAEWVDFRAFLARKLEIPHPELDNVFSQLFSRPADDTARIDQEKAACFESYFQRTFSQPGLSLFPNPFFETPGNTGPAANGFSPAFIDVAPVHPIYTAIKPLTELGIVCGDNLNRIRPEQNMTWSDWQRLATDLFTRLSLETGLIERLCAGRSGDMSNHDIRNFLEHLRERLMIKSTSPLIYAREKSIPCRLEALGALAAMVKELNETL